MFVWAIQAKYLDLNYGELLTLATDLLQVTLTQEQAMFVESNTRLQSSSRLWF